jgi:hypothetical protein
MALSTNSIIHYTKSIDSLKQILESGFKVKYCYEKIDSTEKGHLQAAFPMVSFCDIPLSQVKEHIESYGEYGIGLRKDWAKSKKLSPVLYFDKDSELMNYLREEFERLLNKVKEEEYELSDLDHLLNILAYSKNYEADLKLKGSQTIKNYRFYNEREWRFVPNKTILGEAKLFLNESVYGKDKKKYNDALEHIRLTFDTKDISYIIVKNESEIKEITQSIRNLFADKCTMQEMEILLTRIITTDQIFYDF